jgi:hypothetical protein
MKSNKAIFSILAIFAVSIFPVVFLYTYNADEVNLSEAVLPISIFAGTGIILGIIATLFSKSFSKGAIISIMFILLLSNYALLEKGFQLLFPSLKYWHVLPIFIFILLHVAYLVHKKAPVAMADMTVKIISVVFSGLILMNFAFAVPSIISKVSLENTKQLNSEELRASNEENERKPNIYMIILDEYASFNMIKEYYNYDNAEFASLLEENGFTVSYNSHNESIITTTITTNLVNLDYVVDNTIPEIEKRNKRINGKLFSILNEKGYTIKGVGHADLYGLNDAAGVADKGSKTIGGETFMDILLQRSVIYPFVNKNNSAYAQMIKDSVAYVADPNNISSEGEVIIMHLLGSHTPFVVDKNGNPIPPEHYMNWKDRQYYLGQYIYTTRLIMQLLNSVIKNDPDSIIILQSDHGPRASTDPELFMTMFKLKDMKGILNAVYYRGEPIPEIKGKSGVNTLRIVLDKLFDLGLGLVEVPEDDYQYK